MIAIDVQSRIGVLITYHNEGGLLTKCLSSLTQSSDQPDEIWIYDDASDAPAADYVPAGLEVKIVRGEVNQRWPSYGRNVLLQHCSCDYIHFHDADDSFSPEWCAAVRKIIHQDRPDVVFTEMAIFVDGRLVCDEFQHLRTLANDGDLQRFCIRNGLWTATGTYLRKKVEEIGGYDAGSRLLTSDYDFHIRFASLRPQYRLLFEPLIHVRRRDGSQTSNERQVYMHMAECLRRSRSRLPDEYQRDICDRLATFGTELYRLGAPREAAKVLAASLEPLRRESEDWRSAYRVIASAMGTIFAECCRLASLTSQYRLIFDPLIRYELRNGGRNANRKRLCRAAVKYLIRLRSRLTHEYQPHISEQLAVFGAELYRIGAHREATTVFAASREIVPPRYVGHRRPYRMLATLLGQGFAEWLRHRLLARSGA